MMSKIMDALSGNRERNPKGDSKGESSKSNLKIEKPREKARSSSGVRLSLFILFLLVLATIGGGLYLYQKVENEIGNYQALERASRKADNRLSIVEDATRQNQSVIAGIQDELAAVKEELEKARTKTTDFQEQIKKIQDQVRNLGDQVRRTVEDFFKMVLENYREAKEK